MKKNHLITIFIILVLLLILAFATYYINSKAKERRENEAVKTLFSDDPAAKFVDLQNNTISLSEYEDSIIVVNTWASWSPYTAIEFPILDELAARYKDKGIRFLAINRKETKDQVDRYLATLPEYNNLEKIVDVNDFYYLQAGGYSMPETIIYDNKGKIIQHIRGVIVKEEIESILNNLVDKEK